MDILLKRIRIYHRVVKPLLFIGIMGLAVVFGVFFSNNNTIFDDEIVVRVNNRISLQTDISQTPLERSVGLSKYDSMNKDQAMLFIFDEPNKYSFWMKDMKFPIDIIWLNENKEIVSIKENADPADYPQSYHPDAEALYVLETVAGFSQKNSLQRGQQLDW